MSKAKAKVESVSTKSIRKTCDRVVTAISKAYDENRNSSTLLDATIAACTSVFGKVEPTGPELDYIANETSRLQGWEGTPGEKFAKSQVRRICKNAIELPKAIKQWRAANNGSCSMATALNLCTELQTSSGNVKQAVESLSTKKAAKAKGKKLTVKQEVAQKMSALVNIEKIDPALKKALIAMAKKHNVRLT
jgi:hypothetical protein